jgi:hypothetical protein
MNAHYSSTEPHSNFVKTITNLQGLDIPGLMPEGCFLGGIVPLKRTRVIETEDWNETKPTKIHYTSSALRKVESKAELHAKMRSTDYTCKTNIY